MKDINILKINQTSFPVKLALTEEEQTRGLMNEPFPTPILAFLYKRPQINKFWMKSTIAALDIVFCHKSKIINICQGVPLSTALIGKDEFSDLVIEFPAGTCRAYDLKINDEVSLSLSKQAQEKISVLFK